MASSRQEPHISSDGCKDAQKAGRAGSLKIRHIKFSSKLTHGTPAGFPSGMPGMGELMLGAMQQLPQNLRHFIDFFLCRVYLKAIAGYPCPLPRIQTEFVPELYTEIGI